MMDEVDLEIVAVLQVKPRASWAEVGNTVGLSPSAVARRWRQMTQDGLAWTGAHPGRRFVGWGVFALLSVKCEPGSVMAVAKTFSGDAEAITVEVLTGAGDIDVTVATSTWEDLTRYILERIPLVPGIQAVETSVGTDVHQMGNTWRTGALEPGKAAALQQKPQFEDVPKMDILDLRICSLLGEDGRMPVGVLAQRAGASPTGVRRRLDRLLASQIIALRCDVAASEWGWPVQIRLRGTLPAPEKAGTYHLQALREVRMAISVTGRNNLYATAWLRRIGELAILEERIRLAWRFDIGDRSVVMRTLKRMGHLLDEHGNKFGYQPQSVWGGSH